MTNSMFMGALTAQGTAGLTYASADCETSTAPCQTGLSS
jgi:hypothetical protein